MKISKTIVCPECLKDLPDIDGFTYCGLCGTKLISKEVEVPYAIWDIIIGYCDEKTSITLTHTHPEIFNNTHQKGKKMLDVIYGRGNIEYFDRVFAKFDNSIFTYFELRILFIKFLKRCVINKDNGVLITTDNISYITDIPNNIDEYKRLMSICEMNVLKRISRKFFSSKDGEKDHFLIDSKDLPSLFFHNLEMVKLYNMSYDDMTKYLYISLSGYIKCKMCGILETNGYSNSNDFYCSKECMKEFMNIYKKKCKMCNSSIFCNKCICRTYCSDCKDINICEECIYTSNICKICHRSRRCEYCKYMSDCNKCKNKCDRCNLNSICSICKKEDIELYETCEAYQDYFGNNRYCSIKCMMETIRSFKLKPKTINYEYGENQINTFVEPLRIQSPSYGRYDFF